MSRYPSSTQQRIRAHSSSETPYQGTTVAASSSYHQQINGHYSKPSREDCYGTSSRNQCCDLAQYALLSDDTFTDTNTYYDYYPDNGYHVNPKKDTHSDSVFTEDSESLKLPYYEYEEVSSRRHSRHTSSDHSFKKKAFQLYRQNSEMAAKDMRRVYPNQDNVCNNMCQEAQRCLNDNQALGNNFLNRGGPLSRISSERPQSSLSSGVTSAMVDGCGGHCQTFENVCYYFLQVAFTMGILIGASLCIAGALLRKSAARNLQVLVYIGALLFSVSALLLGVQCNARKAARNRRKALRNAKRGPIPLETFPPRNVAPVGILPIKFPTDAYKGIHPTVVPASGPVPIHRPQELTNSSLEEEQGIPWWRRKELAAKI